MPTIPFSAFSKIHRSRRPADPAGTGPGVGPAAAGRLRGKEDLRHGAGSLLKKAGSLCRRLRKGNGRSWGNCLNKGYRLACETVLSGEARVRIPEESQTRPPVILTSDGFGELPVRLRPAVEPYYLEVPPPVLEKVTADRERLLKALEAGYGLKKVAVDPLVLPHLPQTLRARENRVTAAVRNGREVVGLFPGREERLLGLAVDIGTTTLVAYLLDLQTGERLAVSSALNPQVHFGDDVITRIAFCQKDPEGSVQLREAVREGINDLIGRVVEKAGVPDRADPGSGRGGKYGHAPFFSGIGNPISGPGPVSAGGPGKCVRKGPRRGSGHQPFRNGASAAAQGRVCRQRHHRRHSGHGAA